MKRIGSRHVRGAGSLPPRYKMDDTRLNSTRGGAAHCNGSLVTMFPHSAAQRTARSLMGRPSPFLVGVGLSHFPFCVAQAQAR